METKSGWPIALKYGLMLAFSNIAFNLIFYIINPNSMDGKFTAMGVIQLLLTSVVGIWILIMGTKVRRDQDLEGNITYGKSLGFMMQTSIPAALIISFYTYIFFAFIAPEFFEKMLEMQANQMAEKGMSDEQIEQTMSMTKKFSNPLMMTIFGAFGVMFQLLIFSLIGSIFTKKEPKNID
jgi:hypothetical protein